MTTPDPIPLQIPAAAPVGVGLHSPLRWLALGWADLRRNPVPGLVHGLLLTAFGAFLLWAARDQFWLLGRCVFWFSDRRADSGHRVCTA